MHVKDYKWVSEQLLHSQPYLIDDVIATFQIDQSIATHSHMSPITIFPADTVSDWASYSHYDVIGDWAGHAQGDGRTYTDILPRLIYKDEFSVLHLYLRVLYFLCVLCSLGFSCIFYVFVIVKVASLTAGVLTLF